jgi:dipeptidyl aminopeptidase/acylaminoacyl peptidase
MSKEEKAKEYKERSAIYHVDKIKTPLAFLHSREDTVVPISQAELIFDALKDQIDAKLVKFSGEGHSMGKPATVKLWISEGEAWWRTHLL